MPGFVTHYVFGINSYKQITSPQMKKIIKNNRHVYTVGLQGPDLFFYFLPSSMGIMTNIANIMHKTNTNLFFENMLNECYSFKTIRDRETALSYIAGFMGHYLLDTTVHPYVYSRVGTESTKEQLGVHFGLETDIDRDVLLHYKNISLLELAHDSLIMLSLREKKLLTTLLQRSIAKTYGITFSRKIIRLVLWCFQWENRFLMDKKERKKAFFTFFEHKIMGYSFVSPLLINNAVHEEDACNQKHEPWKNPWSENSFVTHKSVFDMIDDLTPTYANYMRELYLAYRQKKPSRLTNLLGNKSYNTGLEI